MSFWYRDTTFDGVILFGSALILAVLWLVVMVAINQWLDRRRWRRSYPLLGNPAFWPRKVGDRGSAD